MPPRALQHLPEDGSTRPLPGGRESTAAVRVTPRSLRTQLRPVAVLKQLWEFRRS